MTCSAFFNRAVLFAALSASMAFAADNQQYCGEEGVWIQALGAGGPQINDGFASSSYLVWIDNQARLLVDTGPGSSASFDRAKAKFEDLDAIVYTHLHVDHAADFPAFVKGSYFLERETPLPVFGPDGSDEYPATSEMIDRLIGKNGAFPYLADFLTFKSSGGYKIQPRDIAATGNRRWAQFRNDRFKLSAIPVNHSIVPALAWRMDIGEQSIVFTGDFNNQKNAVPKFAKDADALVIHHAIPEGARGEARELHVIPSQIGRIANQAGVRMVLIGHRMTRTRGIESQSRLAMEEHYAGPLLFLNDLECWGL